MDKIRETSQMGVIFPDTPHLMIDMYRLDAFDGVNLHSVDFRIDANIDSYNEAYSDIRSKALAELMSGLELSDLMEIPSQ